MHMHSQDVLGPYLLFGDGSTSDDRLEWSARKHQPYQLPIAEGCCMCSRLQVYPGGTLQSG